MPWRESSVGKQRKEFVLEALQPGCNMAALCRKHEVSRKTGYKWIERFEKRGLAGLENASRRPHRFAQSVSGEIVFEVLALRERYPRWGPKKLQVLLRRALGGETDVEIPSVRTVARILERAGQTSGRRGRTSGASTAPTVAPDSVAGAPNDIWTVDFKGWWRTGDGQRCEPLTVRDAHSRYVLALELLASMRIEHVRPAFERLFERYGLPRAIQVDNGQPFASVRSPHGLTKLSAWWVSLGIRVIRGRPAHPQDNGAHERMHVDVRNDLEVRPERTRERQQLACEAWRREFNDVRPHEALGGKTPTSMYAKSARRFFVPPPPSYRGDSEIRKVSANGDIWFHQRRIPISKAVAGYRVGLQVGSDGMHLVCFYDLEICSFDLNDYRIEGGPARDGAKGE